VRTRPPFECIALLLQGGALQHVTNACALCRWIALDPPGAQIPLDGLAVVLAEVRYRLVVRR
jgi:hypothetical protein